MASSFYDRVKIAVATTGTGSTVASNGAAVRASFRTVAEAGIVNGVTVTYLLEQGSDYEISEGVYSSGGNTFGRTVRSSKVSGTAGTSKIDLDGTAILTVIAATGDMRDGLSPLEYGAVGDGSVNDTTAMQAWVAALSSTKRKGTLLGKTYRMSSGVLTLTDDVTIEGPGEISYEGTGRPLTLNGDRIALRNFKLTGNQGGSYVDGNSGIYMQRATFNPLAITTAENIIIDGLEISGFGANAVNLFWVNNFHIVNNNIHDVGFTGISVISGTNGVIDGNHIIDVDPGSGGLRYGIVLSRVWSSPHLKLADSPRSKNIRVTNNHVENIPDYVALDTHGGRDLIFSGNHTVNCRIGVNIEHGTMVGTAQAGGAATITLAALAQATDDYYNDLVIATISGTGSGQLRKISDYVGSTKVATVSLNWDTQPDSTTGYAILEPNETDTAQAGSTASTIVLASGANANNDYYNGKMVYIIAGTGDNQSNLISDYTGASKTANVANSWSVTPDNTSVYAIMDYYTRGGDPPSMVVVGDNTFEGVGSSDTVGPAVAVDGWSGAGETAKGIRVHGNMIYRHGHQSGSTFSVGGAVLVNEAEGVIVDSNSFDNCLGRAVCVNTNAIGTKIANNAVFELQSQDGVHTAFETVAATSSMVLSGNSIHGVSYGTMIEVGSFNSTKGVVADYLNQTFGHTAFGGVYPTFLSSNAISRIKGSIVGAARCAAMFDGTGATGAKSLNWSMVSDLRFAAPTVSKTGTGDYTLTWPSGLFGNAKVAAVISGADPASGEIRTAIITACSSTSVTFKFFDAASAAAIDPVDVWVLGFGR